MSVGFVVYSAPADEAVARGTISFLVIAVPIAAGLYALRVPENARFGFALVAAGLAWSTTALGEASESLPYSIGRVVGWLVFPSLIYLMLAFPQGKLDSGAGRALFRALIAVLVLLYLGSALVVEHYPPYTPWATCRERLPAERLPAAERRSRRRWTRSCSPCARRSPSRCSPRRSS